MASGKRKGWDQLSPDYRKRLGRAGVSQRDYEVGNPIKAARGHARTPERPRQAVKRPQDFPEYLEKRGVRDGGRLAPLDEDLVAHVLSRINESDAYEARTTTRRLVESQSGRVKIELARQLGIAISIPPYGELTYGEQLGMAELWLRAFMTHARASDDPLLAGERLVLVDQYNGMVAEAYRRRGIPQNSKYFWTEFKRSYSTFFGQGILPGV